MFVHKDGSVTGSVDVKKLAELRKTRAESATEAKKRASKAPAPKEPAAKAETAEKSATEAKKEG